MIPANQDTTTEDYVYVLIEQGTNGVVGFTRCRASAKAVLLANRRLKLNSFDFAKGWVEPEFREADLSGHYKLEVKQGARKFEPLSTKSINDQFYSTLKKGVPIRLFFQNALYSMSESIMLPVSESPKHDRYLNSIVYELSQCRPEEDLYSEGLKSYAQASGCDAWTAYQELKITADNFSHAQLRNLGLYIKFRNQLNQTRASREEQGQVLKLARDAFVNNSFV